MSSPWLRAASVGVTVATVGLACASAPPITMTDFAAAQTKSKLVLFMEKTPASCVQATWSTELCSWQLGNRYSAWHPLAASIDTRDRIVVVCELPVDGGPRASDACSVHPARTIELGLPDGQAVARQARRRGGRPSVDAYAERTENERLQVYANRLLAARVNLVQVSRLMGGGPNECTPTGQGMQTCLWKLGRRDAGWDIAARIADTKGRVRLYCDLPLDGSQRAPDSCTVQAL